MTDITTLQSLRDRVAKAQSGDREIDADIAEIFGYVPPECEDGPELCGVPATWAGGGKIWSAPKFTSSIEDAAAWVERVFPGMLYRHQHYPLGNYTFQLGFDGGYRWLSTVNAHTPALAIVLAGLDALIAKEKTDGTQ